MGSDSDLHGTSEFMSKSIYEGKNKDDDDDYTHSSKTKTVMVNGLVVGRFRFSRLRNFILGPIECRLELPVDPV